MEEVSKSEGAKEILNKLQEQELDSVVLIGTKVIDGKEQMLIANSSLPKEKIIFLIEMLKQKYVVDFMR